MGLLDIGLRYALETPQRREEQRRWKTYGEPLAQAQLEEQKARWGEGGIEHRKIKLDEDTFKQRTHEFEENLKNAAADRGIRLTEDDTRRLTIGANLMVHTMENYPENVNAMWEGTGLNKTFGDMDWKPGEKKGEWRAGLIDAEGGPVFWKWNLESGGTPELHDYRNQGLSSMGGKTKMGDFKTGIQSILARHKPRGASDVTIDDEGNFSEGAASAYQVMVEAAKTDEQAKNDLADYESIWGRMREIMGLQRRQSPALEDPRTVRMRQQAEFAESLGNPLGRPSLSNFGQPRAQQQTPPLTDEIVAQYLQMANGDRELAKRMAQQDGYTW